MCSEQEKHYPGFQFSNFSRNEKLVANGYSMPKCQKTGTTIAGLIFKDGVILGADTRATSGSIVADKLSKKLHLLQPNIYCAGAGTAADLEMTTGLMASRLELHRLYTNRDVPVVCAKTMFKRYLLDGVRSGRKLGVALVLGGVDTLGYHVYTIHPHGSAVKCPYTTMGSGSLAAMTVIEQRWNPNLELEEAKVLMRDAIAAGIANDLGSGSQIDLCVITKTGATLHRPYALGEVKTKRQGEYATSSRNTEILEGPILNGRGNVTPSVPLLLPFDDSVTAAVVAPNEFVEVAMDVECVDLRY